MRKKQTLLTRKLRQIVVGLSVGRFMLIAYSSIELSNS